MNTIVGDFDIVFLTLDTMRFDVAQSEMNAGRLPTLGQHFSLWEKRHTPGSFTYAAHHAFFSGFLPTPVDHPTAPRLMAVDFPGSTSIAKQTKCFHSANIVAGLMSEGYHTLCIGGVGFFNLQTPLGCVLPDMFADAYWDETTGVTCPDSTRNQVDVALSRLINIAAQQRVFLFMNISAIHQPNYFYDPQAQKKQDSIHSHAAALRYVDAQLGRLFDFFKTRSPTLFIICSDHGTCYGEEGYTGHRLSHEVVWTVPYAEFIQEAL